MGNFTKCAAVVIMVCMVLSLNVFAGNSATMILQSDTTLKGQELKVGTYKVAWTGEGSTVQVTITGNGKNLTAPATKVELKGITRASVVKNPDGSLKEIRFDGKKLGLVFNE